MSDLNVPPMLWLVAFQMGLYALAWVLCGALLGEDRPAVVHWGVFLLLTGIVMLLAGARGEPRQWIHFNGANVLSLIGFAVMRRGTEMFMRLRPNDLELAVVLALVCGAVGLLGPDPAHASWRIALTYAGQGYLVLATMARVARPMRREFGRRTLLAIVGPGVGISLMLGWLALQQLLQLDRPMEMQRNTASSYGLMYYYLGGTALFNFGFMVLLTQRLVVGLREASRHDPLTGLPNRRALAEAMQHRWLRHRRDGEAFALLVIDIDHFKQINDGHGHAVGDDALAHVARLLERSVRAADLVGRIGGEEFLVVLPGADAAAALHLAERLRETVQAEALPLAAGALPTTISIGVAVAAAGDPSIEAVQRRADTALYRAKAAGRNRCELAEALAAPAIAAVPQP